MYEICDNSIDKQNTPSILKYVLFSEILVKEVVGSHFSSNVGREETHLLQICYFKPRNKNK